MRIHLPIFLFLFTPILAFSQLNMVLQDSVTYTVGVNDVNGWVAPDGKEYALVGLNTGVAIVDINEDSLKEVAFVAGVNNLWRDINTYGHYAYVSSEAQVGLLIIDLQYLPDSVQTFIWQDSLPTPNGPKPFKKAHTLWTDEHGFLYLNGSNLNSGGVIMLDVASNPTDPVFLGYAPAIYSHDCYSRDSIIYSAEIYDGNLSIYDAHDPANITLIGRVKTPYEFTHNAWLSDNSQYMFTTDERANSYVTSYDISDPGNIRELDRFRQASTEGSGNIAHNVYVWNDWLVIAYYANGTLIVDASRPDNLVEVGNFDSYLGPNGAFPGVWGSYPWLPSGKILTSDRNSGLYVFIPTYVHACYLEGTVIDSVTRLPLDNATVAINSDEIVLPQATKPNGVFKMGKAVPGQYTITATKDGYYPKTFSAAFINGEVLAPEIELVPIPTYVFSGKVINYESANVPFAKVTMVGPDNIYETTCDENGDFLIPALYKGSYQLTAGIWGHTYESDIEMNAPKALTIQLVQGYKDDFDADFGWTVSGQVTSGTWGRGILSGQKLFDTYTCGSDGDSPNDFGSYAYSTGLSSSADVLQDEVSGGTTWLVSPPMDLTNAIEPKISFDYWLCEFPPNQYNGVNAWLTNGVDTFLLENLVNDTISGSWQTRQYSNLPLQAPLDQIRFMISASDTTSGASDYILKVHLDKFKLSQSGLATGEVLTSGTLLKMYPNPLSGSTLYLMPGAELKGNVITIDITDPQGRNLYHVQMEKQDLAKGIHVQIPEGIHFVQWHTNRNETGIEKLLVLKN